MARRTFGNVRQVKPSGRYQASYWYQGERYLAPRTFQFKADANAFLAEVETDIHRGVHVNPNAGKLTVEELGAEWRASDPSKRASTRSRDETILRLHIYPYLLIGKRTLGDTRIDSVTKAHVQSLVSKWTADKKAPQTIHRQFNVVRAIFTYAVENDRILRTPCRAIKLPEIEHTHRHPLSGEEVAAIAEAMPTEYRSMVYLGAILGLRWGEVAGLRLRSLDLDRSIVIVTEQLDRALDLGPPKSRAGIRTLAMPHELRDLLREHVKAQNLTDGSALLFSSQRAHGPLRYSNWRRRAWAPAVTKAGLTAIGFHDLRRASATALVRERVDIKTAQARLGHADPRLTLALYAAESNEADQDAAQRLGQRFLRPIAHESRMNVSRSQKARGKQVS